MNREQIVKWKDIYSWWKAAIIIFSEIQGSIRCLRVDISEPKYGPICYYDWVKKDNEEATVKAGVAALASRWSELDSPWSKGTINTVSMLASCEAEEEFAAIWLCAFSLTLLRRGLDRSGTRKNAACIERESCAVFARKYGYWHHSSRDFFPEFYIPDGLLWESEDLSVLSLVELAAVNASLVMSHFTPIEYKKV